MEVSGQFNAPAVLSPGKEPPVPTGQEAGWAHNLSGRGGEEKNSQPPPGIEPKNPDRPARSPELHRLSYQGSSMELVIYFKLQLTSFTGYVQQ
jgi:hypothetical protein